MGREPKSELERVREGERESGRALKAKSAVTEVGQYRERGSLGEMEKSINCLVERTGEEEQRVTTASTSLQSAAAIYRGGPNHCV